VSGTGCYFIRSYWICSQKWIFYKTTCVFDGGSSFNRWYWKNNAFL